MFVDIEDVAPDKKVVKIVEEGGGGGGDGGDGGEARQQWSNPIGNYLSYKKKRYVVCQFVAKNSLFMDMYVLDMLRISDCKLAFCSIILCVY